MQFSKEKLGPQKEKERTQQILCGKEWRGEGEEIAEKNKETGKVPKEEAIQSLESEWVGVVWKG